MASVSPESLSVNYATVPWAEMRRNGTLEFLNKLMMEKGLYYFARTGDGVPYHIYLNKPISKADLSGLKIDRKSTRLNSSHMSESRMPSSA